MGTPTQCPGFDQLKHLSSFLCRCPVCNREIEIFHDEFDREVTCPQCKQPVDFTKCSLYAKP